MDAVATVLAALAVPSQRQRLLRLTTTLGDQRLLAERLSATERIDGEGFRLELLALSSEANLPLTELLGQPALLELQTDQGDWRPFHGHLSVCERIGSNGGLARYRLRIEPWLALLAYRVDSYVFHDQSVIEIVENVFADYTDQGSLAPSWRWDLNDRSQYARRSLTTQYEESDLAFVQRLLAEEGIYYWFEHQADAGSATLGRHTLVLADHAQAGAELGRVRYHRADASEAEDSVQRWSPARRARVHKVARASWDYRSLDLRPAEADSPVEGALSAEDQDTSGPYGWPDLAHGQRRAQQHLDAQRVAAYRFSGAGRWRRLAPGHWFQLDAHPGTDPEARYLCLRVDHQARNNLGAEVFDALEQLLGEVATPGVALPPTLAAGPGPVPQIDTDYYDNQFEVLPQIAPYRPQLEDGDGARLHPRPRVYGTLSAIVVSDGEPLLSDRDYRIKVQFPYQRGSDASSALAHPSGADNAPGNGGAWTWVRVMTPWAGDNWGSVLLPRKGQEVLVGFLEGDIDRPVVIGVVYNGRGQEQAAHNRVAGGGAGASGNAPAWFDGNDHAAVYTGLKSQALGLSADGRGGYQQLRLDDSPGQGRAQLSSTQHASTLTLGHLKGGQDNRRQGERGYGLELRSQAGGAVRAGQGLLLSSEAGNSQLASPQALSELQQSQQRLQALSEAARAQQAELDNDAQTGTLPAQSALAQLQEHLQANQRGSEQAGIGGGGGQVPGWSAPQLLGSGAAGVLSLTPASQHWVAGSQGVLSAGHALNWLSQGHLVQAVAGGLVLYTQGSAASAASPNQERGIALHAAQGKLSARAHKQQARVAAKTRVQITSTEADVTIQAKQHLLATAGGAYLKLEGDNIELGAPGSIEFKATRREWTGPKGTTLELPKLPQVPSANQPLKFNLNLQDMPGPNRCVLAHTPWKIVQSTSRPLGMDALPKENMILEGLTDENGHLALDDAAQETLAQAYLRSQGSLWLMYPGRAVPLSATEEREDASDEDKLVRAMSAAGFSGDVRTYIHNAHVAGELNYALEALELNHAPDILKKIDK